MAQAREDLALCYRLCERFGYHEGVCNHLTVAVSDDRFLLIPYGVHWSQVTASRLLLLNHKGDVLEGDGSPEITAFKSHRACHAALGDDGRVVLHTHMPWATALCAIRPEKGGTLLPVHQNICRFHNRVAYDLNYDGLFVSDEESNRIAQIAVEHKRNTGLTPRAMLCANHGVFVFAKTVAEAWDDLYYLERLCEVQVRALQGVGIEGLRLMSDKALKLVSAQYEPERLDAVHAHWRGLEELMRKKDPPYSQ
eukprot:TRINITY_DN92476_c0_g1_i1.p1 TRINITY_DN92476_c0_g1~~TRINITY_DN92476_c0_g1_i1.p1  ORF type:complete len:266 (-),score=42.95 TRINITY_DN92476_c0_g1_i1:101-856(-)